jgi:hypothetical protein
MRAAAILIASALFASGAFAQDSAQAMYLAGLRGVHKIGVQIDKLEMPAIAAGIDTAALRTQVELRLRRSGLTLVRNPTDAEAVLRVVVSPEKSQISSYWIYMVSVELWQATVLVRPPQARMLAATWWEHSVNGIGAARLNEVILQDVGQRVDAFCNDWLEANPVSR